MKLGEIKTEAMLLMFPDIDLTAASVSCDEPFLQSGGASESNTGEKTANEDLSEFLFALQTDPNYAPYLNAMTGAVNRCFSYLEQSGAVALKCFEIPNTAHSGEIVRYNLKDMLPDLFSIEKITYSNGTVYIPCMDFDREAENTVVLTAPRTAGSFGVIYTPKLKRITCKTSNLFEPELSEGAASAIPYFIKGDIFVNDDANEAAEARSIFADRISKIAGSPNSQGGVVESVYCLGRL